MQTSLVGELSSAITLILMTRAWNSHLAETSETDYGHGRVTGLGCPPRNCFQKETIAIKNVLFTHSFLKQLS